MMAVKMGIEKESGAEIDQRLSVYALLEANRHEDALKAVRLLLASEPEDCELHWLAGVAARWSGLKDVGLEHFERCIQLDPSESEPFFWISIHWHELRKYTRSLKMIESAIEVCPDEARYFVQLGWNHYCLDQLPEARLAALEAARLDPDEIQVATLKACIDSRAGRSDWEIKKDLEAALAQEPENHRVHYSLALSHLGTGNSEDALASVLEALRLEPNMEVYQATLVTLGQKRHVWLRFLFLPVALLPKPGKLLRFMGTMGWILLWPFILWPVLSFSFSDLMGAIAGVLVFTIVLMPGFWVSRKLLLPRIENDVNVILNIPSVLRIFRRSPWWVTVGVICTVWLFSVWLGVVVVSLVPRFYRALIAICFAVVVVGRCLPAGQRTRYHHF